MSDNNMILSAVLYFNISCECAYKVSGAECVHKHHTAIYTPSFEWPVDNCVFDGSYAL